VIEKNAQEVPMEDAGKPDEKNEGNGEIDNSQDRQHGTHAGT
jgi:hypothetical protein